MVLNILAFVLWVNLHVRELLCQSVVADIVSHGIVERALIVRGLHNIVE